MSLNPITEAPWALSETTRRKIAGVLSRDRYARSWQPEVPVMRIDQAAADYRRWLAMKIEIEDGHGRHLDRIDPSRPMVRALRAGEPTRRRGRPRLTRERWHLVHALLRIWPGGRPTIAPKSSFVRVLELVLSEVQRGDEKAAYQLARRVLDRPAPPVVGMEPIVLDGMLPR